LSFFQLVRCRARNAEVKVTWTPRPSHQPWPARRATVSSSSAAGPPASAPRSAAKTSGHADWTLIDPEPPGGLSRSYVDDHGFTWDLGGHVIFSHYQYFDDAMDFSTKEWYHLQRESWVRIADVWVPYPFQNNIHRLPPKEKEECFEGLLEVYRATFDGPPKNFKEYFTRQWAPALRACSWTRTTSRCGRCRR
jgi:hypothetical protein